MAILVDLNDPRVRDVTVTYVEVSGDLRTAKIHVSIMGDETQQQLSLRGLKNAAGFLQAKIAEKIDLRYTPKLNFILDQGVKQSIEISRILKEVLPDSADADAAEPDMPESEKTGPETTESGEFDSNPHDDNDQQE